jgi:hypothetical protein
MGLWADFIERLSKAKSTIMYEWSAARGGETPINTFPYPFQRAMLTPDNDGNSIRGMEWYRDANGNLALGYTRDSSGRCLVYTLPFTDLTPNGGDGAGNLMAVSTTPPAWRSFYANGSQASVSASPVGFVDETGTSMAAPGAGNKWEVAIMNYCIDVGAATGTTIAVRTTTTDSYFSGMIFPVAGGNGEQTLYRKAKDTNETLEAFVIAPPAAMIFKIHCLARIVPA